MARYPTTLNPENKETELFKALNKFENRFRRQEAVGNPSKYEVWVDKLREIGPTTDPDEFVNVLDYVDMRKTEEIDIRIYHKQSRNNDQHVYFLNPPKAQLDGKNKEMKAETVEQVRKEFEYKRMKEELEKLKEENKVLDEYSDQLEEELKAYRSKKLHLGEVNLVEVGGMLLEGYLKRNPQVLGQLVGGGNALAGPGGETAANSGATEGASISRAEEDESEAHLLGHLQAAFSTVEFEAVMRILEMLSHCPEKIPQVLSLLESPTTPVNL